MLRLPCTSDPVISRFQRGDMPGHTAKQTAAPSWNACREGTHHNRVRLIESSFDSMISDIMLHRRINNEKKRNPGGLR